MNFSQNSHKNSQIRLKFKRKFKLLPEFSVKKFKQNLPTPNPLRKGGGLTHEVRLGGKKCEFLSQTKDDEAKYCEAIFGVV